VSKQTHDVGYAALAAERSIWSSVIDRNLRLTVESIKSLDNTEQPEITTGWLLVEQALRHGAEAMRSMRAPG
jgi:hypothetical protein